MATCTETAGLLHDFIDDALPPGVRQGLAAHLRACPPCARAVKQHRCARRLLRRLPREPMPRPMKQLLLAALRSTSAPPRSDPPRQPLAEHSAPHTVHPSHAAD